MQVPELYTLYQYKTKQKRKVHSLTASEQKANVCVQCECAWFTMYIALQEVEACVLLETLSRSESIEMMENPSASLEIKTVRVCTV